VINLIEHIIYKISREKLLVWVTITMTLMTYLTKDYTHSAGIPLPAIFACFAFIGLCAIMTVIVESVIEFKDNPQNGNDMEGAE